MKPPSTSASITQNLEQNPSSCAPLQTNPQILPSHFKHLTLPQNPQTPQKRRAGAVDREDDTRAAV